MFAIKIINVISDTNIGGAGKILINFLKLTSKDEFEHIVIVPKRSLLIPEIEKLGIEYIEIEGIGEKSFSFSSVKLLYGMFRKLAPDVVHTHASLSARVAAKIYGKCGIVHTRHSVFDQSNAKKRFPLKQINGFINNFFSDIIIAVSPAAKDNIVETGANPAKIKVIFNGIEKTDTISDDEKSKILRKYGFNASDFTCAMIARFEEVKGHRYVLEAAEILKDYKDIKFIFAGAGGTESEVRQLTEDLALRNCVFAGFVKEIYEIENIMSLQINASFGTEATSLSLLEGMSLGIPAVASDFGGNPYVIESGINGFVVEKKNSEQLAEKIFELYNDRKLYEKLSEGAKKIFLRKFTSQAMVAGIEEIYRELARSGGKTVL